MNTKKLHKYLCGLFILSLLAGCNGEGNEDIKNESLAETSTVDQGVDVDPNIVDALFQDNGEVNENIKSESLAETSTVDQGVDVDPNIVDALFQEMLTATDNTEDIGTDQSTSTASPTYTPALGTVSKQLHFEWNYDISLPGLAGYTLYQNGQYLLTINDPTTLTIDDTVNVELGQTVIFTITAFDVNGNESAISEPYSFDLPLEVVMNNLLPPADGSDNSAG